MLQNDPVRNLQYDSDLRIAQQTRVDPILYRENTIITSQPRPPRPPSSLNAKQIPSPVSTVSNLDTDRYRRSFIPAILPLSGLESLRGIPCIHIHQTFELNDMLTSVSSENRYSIRAPSNDALYCATESSTSKNRLMWGAARPFSMHLLDRTNQEALTLRRNLACGLFCCTCKPQNLEIWAPPGDLLGYVQETYSFFGCELTLQNANKEILYLIEGPPTVLGYLPKEARFKILSGDSLTQQGSITRLWNTDISTYTLNVYFAEADLDVKKKALFIGAAFLLEYMFFQRKSCW